MGPGKGANRGGKRSQTSMELPTIAAGGKHGPASGRASAPPGSASTIHDNKLPVRPIGFLYTNAGKYAESHLHEFFRPKSGGMKDSPSSPSVLSSSNKEQLSGKSQAKSSLGLPQLGQGGSSSLSGIMNRPSSRQAAAAVYANLGLPAPTQKSPRRSKHESKAHSLEQASKLRMDALEKLKEAGREIGIPVDIPMGKTLDMNAILSDSAQEVSRWVKKESSSRPSSAASDAGMRRRTMNAEQLQEHVFQLESVLNVVRFERQRKEQMVQELQVQMKTEAGKSDTDADIEYQELVASLAGLKKKVDDLTDEMAAELRNNKSMQIMYRRTLKFKDKEILACDQIKREVEQYNHDLDKVRSRVRDAVKSITESCAPEELDLMRAKLDAQKQYHMKELDKRREIVREAVKLKSEMQAYEEKYKRVQATLERMYDPNVNSPRRNRVKSLLQDFEGKFEKLISSLGDADPERVVEMIEQQKHSAVTWSEAVQESESKIKTLQAEYESLQRHLKHVRFGAVSGGQAVSLSPETIEGGVQEAGLDSPPQAQAQLTALKDEEDIPDSDGVLTQAKVERAEEDMQRKAKKLNDLHRLTANVKTGLRALASRLAIAEIHIELPNEELSDRQMLVVMDQIEMHASKLHEVTMHQWHQSAIPNSAWQAALASGAGAGARAATPKRAPIARGKNSPTTNLPSPATDNTILGPSARTKRARRLSMMVDDDIQGGNASPTSPLLVSNNGILPEEEEGVIVPGHSALLDSLSERKKGAVSISRLSSGLDQAIATVQNKELNVRVNLAALSNPDDDEMEGDVESSSDDADDDAEHDEMMQMLRDELKKRSVSGTACGVCNVLKLPLGSPLISKEAPHHDWCNVDLQAKYTRSLAPVGEKKKKKKKPKKAEGEAEGEAEGGSSPSKTAPVQEK